MLGKIPFRDWPTFLKLGFAALIRAGREIRRFSARRLVRTDSGSILSVYVAGFSFLYLSSVYFHSSALLVTSKFRARTSCFLRPNTKCFHRSQGVRRFIITSCIAMMTQHCRLNILAIFGQIYVSMSLVFVSYIYIYFLRLNKENAGFLCSFSYWIKIFVFRRKYPDCTGSCGKSCSFPLPFINSFDVVAAMDSSCSFLRKRDKDLPRS